MDNSQIEAELEEIESRIDRLRALYEQFFIGIEKLEPQVPRKDIERRMHTLRKEQIRNTGLRFKFQMLVQRFNTMQQYWGRTLREIENGTYRRDVLRAAKRFGEKEALTIVTKKKAERYAVLLKAQEEKRLGAAGVVAAALGAPAIIAEAEEPPAPAPPAQPAPAATTALRWGGIPRRMVAAQQGASSPPPIATKSEAEPADPDERRKKVAALAAEMKAQRAAAVMSFEAGPLDLDLDDVIQRPKSSRPGRKISTSKMAAVTQGQPAPKPPGSQRKISSRKMRAVTSPAATDAGAPPARPNQGALGPRGEPLGTPPRPPPPHGGAPAGSGPRNPPPPPRTPAHSGAGPAPMARPPEATPREARPPEATPREGHVPPAKPAPPAKPPAPPPRAGESGSRDLPEQRLRQIYAKYVETKQSVNESTAGVTFEKMAESLRAQAEKLRETHAAKSVDYDVVVKNGRTMLKPILR